MDPSLTAARRFWVTMANKKVMTPSITMHDDNSIANHLNLSSFNGQSQSQLRLEAHPSFNTPLNNLTVYNEYYQSPCNSMQSDLSMADSAATVLYQFHDDYHYGERALQNQKTEPCHPRDALRSKTSLYDRLDILSVQSS
ncbi:hypothetical protein BOTCAL_0044g00160 [Botryotinia calthae]|uniref:Uncharacterized protein n=1 Tax=Botryotinia calthae TaxID=38488 RepID=A0A4Y8DC14_9HELO|nr:hypothetical protein BOTCAL_0044g00160 [Botryotinia calthae]